MFILMSTRKKKKIMNYKFKTKPYAHQLTALEKSWKKTMLTLWRWVQVKQKY